MIVKNVVALVLAGGKMGDYGVLTQNRAKGALTVAGIYRIIDFALSNLVNSGIHRIGLIIQYLPGSLIEHVGNGHPWDLDNYGKILKIMPPFVGMEEVVWFKGTADAIQQNLNFVRDQKAQHVIVLSGEHVFHIDFRDVLESHLSRNADITVVTKQLTADQHRKRFGYVTVNEEGRILQYHEKPESPPSDIAATGIYIFRASTLTDLVTRGKGSPGEYSLAKDVLERYASDCKTYEYRMEESWEYLETIREYYKGHYRLIRNGHFDMIRRWEILTNLKFRNVGHAPAAAFGKNASVEASMISPGCSIDGHVENSILSPGVKVSPGAVVSNSILLHDCVVEENAILEHVISDRDAVFGAKSIVGKMEDVVAEAEDDSYPLTLIGKAARVGEGIVIPPGTQVRPGKMVSTQQALNLELA